MRIGERDYNIKAGLVVFVGISVVSALVIIYLDMDRNTWSSLRAIRPEYGLLACLLMIAQWVFNGIRFKILINSLENKVGFGTSFKAFMANIFMSAMTPSQTGGGPLQIFILNRAGVSIAKAFTGCLMGAVLMVVCLVISTLGILIFKPDLRMELEDQMAIVFMVALIIFLLLFILFALSIFRIRTIKKIIGNIALFLTRFIKTKKRISIIKRTLGGLDQYSRCMKIFAHTKKYRILIAGLLTMAAISANAMIAPVIIAGLNIHQDVLNVYLTQYLLFFIAYFSPTPGASGIAEFSNYWMMNSLKIEPSMLGVYTLIWRFFTSFFGVSIGGLVVLSLIHKRKKNDSR